MMGGVGHFGMADGSFGRFFWPSKSHAQASNSVLELQNGRCMEVDGLRWALIPAQRK